MRIKLKKNFKDNQNYLNAINGKTNIECFNYWVNELKNQNEIQMLLNPVWHVHNGMIPKENTIMTFSMLLNLVEASNANSKELLWKFVKKYKPNILEKEHPIFNNLIDYAINPKQRK